MAVFNPDQKSNFAFLLLSYDKIKIDLINVNENIDIPKILNIPNIPDIPEIPTIPEIPIIIKISLSWWF